MSDGALERLLGQGDGDPGCEAAFEQLDQYCEAFRRGQDVARRFAELVGHINNCPACREDTEGLLAALEELRKEEPGK